MNDSKPSIRLNQAAIEFNTDVSTIADFLNENGKKINLRKTSKLTNEQYEFLKIKFKSTAQSLEKQINTLTDDLSIKTSKSEIKLKSFSDLKQLKKRSVNSIKSFWHHGKVKWFDLEQGYGFITASNPGQEFYLHISQVVGDTINKNDHVLFKVKPGNAKYKKNNEAVNLYKLSLVEQLLESTESFGSKINFLSTALHVGLQPEKYYQHLFELIKNEISNWPLLILDLEFDGYHINELAYRYKKNIVSADAKYLLEKATTNLKVILAQQKTVLAGHNIQEFDLPILEEHAGLGHIRSYIDTLQLEILLSPTLKSYALDTAHHATEDVEQTLSLLINQIIRLLYLPADKFQKLTKFIDSSFMNLLNLLRDSIVEIDNAIFQHFEKERDKFFIQKRESEQKLKELKQLTANLKAPFLLIAPKQFWPIIAELENMQFISEDDEFSRIVIEEKVQQLPNNSKERYVLERFIEYCSEKKQQPLYINLPASIRIKLKEKVSEDYYTGISDFSSTSEHNYCLCDNELFTVLPSIAGSNYQIVLIEQDFLAVTSKTLITTVDHDLFEQRLNKDGFWLYFTGGQSRVSINKEDLLNIGLENINPIFDNFWIEKSSFSTYQIWANFNLKQMLSSYSSNIHDFTFSKEKPDKTNCKYVLPSGLNKLDITRYNPETKYRDRYWTFQIKLIKSIIGEDGKPTILIINEKNEKQNLYDYFTSQGYFVPDLKASIIRQVQLLVNYPKEEKVMVAAITDIHRLAQSEDFKGLNLILDSFTLEEKWFISKGSGFLTKAAIIHSGISFNGNEEEWRESLVQEDSNDEYESKNTHEYATSSQDVFLLLKLQKPIIDYYRWLFSASGRDCIIWLTDSRLADFTGLEEEWVATKINLPIWQNQAAYDEDYKEIKQYFPSPTARNNIHFDVEEAKGALRTIFLKTDDGETHDWYDYQHDYLDEILPGQKSILVTLPTGGGKSILFQAPALYRGSISGRLTIVITPLKALMEDHVQKLWELGFWASVEYINSDRKDIQYIYRRIAGGEILMLYVTPERFRSRAFIKALQMRLENNKGLEYSVYDEAHCVSQWGLDFRPDYLNSARFNRSLKDAYGIDMPLLLFSATVSEQVYLDFQAYFNRIERLEKYSEAYNPLREHINIEFETCEDSDDKLFQIAASLKEAGFDPEKSRCLIFVRTRNQAENHIATLEEKLSEVYEEDIFYSRVTYFHAGLNAEEREEVYNAYKRGEISILLATKAFGMGMDIPNIHYVYHFGPAGTLEDYLQEVGRAGRNETKLLEAGFSKDKPIRSKCFLEKQDFKYLKTLLRDSKITWTNVLQVYSTIIEYVAHFRSIEKEQENSIILPLDFLSQYAEYDNVLDKDQVLRLCLFWIEKLERIKLGFYAPAQFVFSNYKKPTDYFLSIGERHLTDEIEKAFKDVNQSKKFVSVEANHLLQATKTGNYSDLYKLIISCHNKGVFTYENEIFLKPTKKRIEELKYFYKSSNDPFYPTIEAVFELAENLLKSIPVKQQHNFDHDYLESEIQYVAAEYFKPDLFPWFRQAQNEDDKLSEKKILEEKNEFQKKKARFAFMAADFVPAIRHRSLIEHELGQKPKVIQAVYNGCKNKVEWQTFLTRFKNDLIALVRYIGQHFINQAQCRFNIADLIISLNFQDREVSYLDNLFSIAKWLGYLRFEGSLIPMGIELTLLSIEKVRHEESNFLDKQVYEEFQLTQKLRELRLIALECLSSLSQKEDKDRFITAYFRCDSIDTITDLLIQYFGEDHEALVAFRNEALETAYETLSEEQKKVYDEDITANVQVIAGPGSGKTHTLTLRVARLIHQENVRPENILVLAYNRAVVIELKERLSTLFSKLGYSNLIHKLKVFTFHGFCKFCLKEGINDLNFDAWVPAFIETAKNKPGLISSALGIIKYVFVDEFQDINSQRLELLQLIAKPELTHLTVIGDPNQSIYGYERVATGGSRNPKLYYDKFKAVYQPKELNLSQNYRSFPEILTLAEELISKNHEQFGIISLIPCRKTEAQGYCESILYRKTKVDWLKKLQQMLNETIPETSKPYSQIAVMLRSNKEIYKAYNKIKEADLPNIRVRIQGEGEHFTKIREVARILDYYRKDFEKNLGSNFIDEYKRNVKEPILRKFPCWDQYYLDLFECLLHEFSAEMQENAKHQDLLDYINEISYRDDGQLSKVYSLHSRKVSGNAMTTEVILTTMHKVKGVEFDAVLIPPSFADLPMSSNEYEFASTNALRESIEEERRLMYVALTRAKYRLVYIKWNREEALEKGKVFKLGPTVKQELGHAVNSGFDKQIISWGASSENKKQFSHIHRHVRVGMPVALKKIAKGWQILVKGHLVGMLSAKVNLNTDTTVLTGFTVSNVYRYTYEESLEYDKKHETDYSMKWSDFAINTGYIYLVEFSGYGK